MGVHCVPSPGSAGGAVGGRVPQGPAVGVPTGERGEGCGAVPQAAALW